MILKLQPTNKYNYNNLSNCLYKKTQPLNTSGVNFTGHTQTELTFFKRGFRELVHQTAFDREPQTKQFVCDYIHKYLLNRDTIRIVSGGCSTGEESVSYSMRLNNIKNQVTILGIDPGKKAIKRAKSRTFILEIPVKESVVTDFYEKIETSPYSDYYLVKKTNEGLTPTQKFFKELFDRFFEPTNRVIKAPFSELCQNQRMRRNNLQPLELARKEYRLKDNMAENCQFVRGDIQDIEKILNGEKVEVISFCNSLYHLTVKDLYDCSRTPKKNSDFITENLMKKFKNSLNKDGIVVFGENEGPQMGDFETVPKVMNKLGFLPLNETVNHKPNVWKVNK